MSQISLINRRDLDFFLNEVFKLNQLFTTERFEHCDTEMSTAIIDTALSMARDMFWPAAAEVDADEAHFDGQKVYTPQITKDCLATFKEAGFFGTIFDLESGGMQLPCTLQQAIASIFYASTPSIVNYAFLTSANANMLSEHGDEELKSKFLPPMIEGRWFGTMCLSEPHAGSSLSDITTLATPSDQGHYLLKGTKMWISGGEQDISENIVHMVLAKTPDAPPGVKGISLFLVPKYRVNPDGELGEFNNIALVGINHKMGHRGTTNTLLNFGESGECYGYLVGKLHNGLANMFFMMNEMRIGVGMSSVALGIGGFNYSLDYAKNRPQGRKINNKDPNSSPVMIIEHADIKRLLMLQKVYAEGALSLIFYCAMLVDKQKAGLVDKREAALLLELLTPIAKSWPSEFCLEANKHAMQVLGGYGYTRDYEVERMYRDNRLNPIHEGAHGIHGIDLLGRKVRLENGEALRLLRKQTGKTIAQALPHQELKPFCEDLDTSLSRLEKTVDKVLVCPDIEQALANATPFLDAFGHIIIAWQWLEQAVVAKETLATEQNGKDAFYLGKIAACKFFFRYELPKAHTQLKLVASLDDTCSSLDTQYFSGE